MSPEAVAPLIAAALSALGMGRWISAAERAGLISLDVHKKNRVECVKIGALPAVAASWMGILISTRIDLAVLSAAAAAAAIGLMDDVASLRNAAKVVLPMIFFLPMRSPWRVVLGVRVPAWLSWMWAPLIGSYVVNGVNIYAGFNGLESGSVLIMSTVMAAHAAAAGDQAAAAGFLSLAAAYAAFLPLNWYPARAFPGNVSTFFSGAALAALALKEGLEWPLLVTSIPLLVDFVLKVGTWSRARGKGRSRPGPDGRLLPPPHLSVASLILRVKPMGERDLVLTMLTLVALSGASSFFLPPLILVHPPA